MSRFQEKLWKWMAGRYGMDALYYALLVLSLVFWGIHLFAPHWIWAILCVASLVIAVARMLSRNIARRSRENAAWLRVWTPVKVWFRTQGQRIRAVRTRRYRRCPQCKAVLRLPIRRGKHTVRCPRCGKEFPVRIVI